MPPSFESNIDNSTSLLKFVNGWMFSTITEILILVNAVYIGIYADYTIRNELRRIDGQPFKKSMVDLHTSL